MDDAFQGGGKWIFGLYGVKKKILIDLVTNLACILIELRNRRNQ